MQTNDNSPRLAIPGGCCNLSHRPGYSGHGTGMLLAAAGLWLGYAAVNRRLSGTGL